MSALPFETIEKMRDNLLIEMQNIYKNQPVLDSEIEIEINKNWSLPIKAIVNNAVELCTRDLESSFKKLTKSIKDNNAYIEEWEQQKTEIENSNASEQLKRKKTERIDKKIREIQAANEQEKIEIMKKIHRIYADFYAKTGWINNKLKHQEMDMRWDNKNTCMRKAFFYELMGEYEGFNIRLDEYGNKCFYTPVLLPIQGGHFLPISLHFGSERNYQEFMIKTDAELDNYREDLQIGRAHV